MRATIEIRPIRSKWSFVPLSFHTCVVDSATMFMSGRRFENWLLFVNGRSYDWPLEHTWPVSGFELADHFNYCIEFDEAFYG